MTTASTESAALNTKVVRKRERVARLINTAIRTMLFLFIFFMTIKKKILKGLKKWIKGK